MYIPVYSRPFFLAAVLLHSTSACSEEKNGFVLDNGLIPSSQIFQGGPSKDGILAIDKPEFNNASDTDFMEADDRILGIEINGVAKAFPISILNWHEIVNDATDGHAYTITYCPLCGTGMAFNSDVDGQTLRFGVSGLLYNSDVLLYDRETESLWSQILAKAVTGKYKGVNLVMLPLSHTTWSDWKHRHPSSLVLSRNTGFKRNYDRDPYDGYERSSSLYFPVMNKAPGIYHPKEQVLGLAAGNSFKAYPFIELNKHGKSRFSDSLDGKTFILHWNEDEQTGHITNEEGALVPVIQAYWFAWYAFHPDTLVFTESETQ